MKKSRRLISFFLIFVFGFLSVKNLFSSLSLNDNCLEFGHLHKTEVHNTHAGIHTHSHEDENCHEGKSVLSYSLFPVDVFEIKPLIYKMNFEVVFNLDSNFVSPDLMPERKPPRV